MKKFTIFFLLCVLLAQIGLSQTNLPTVNNYKPLRYGKDGAHELPQRFQVIDLAANNLERNLLQNTNLTLDLQRFDLKESYNFKMYATKAMHDDLAKKYNIRTYSGQNRDNPSEMISLTFSPIGMYGTIQSSKGNYYIEPDQNNRNYAIVFAAKDDPRKPQNEHTCNVGEKHDIGENTIQNLGVSERSGPLAAGDANRPTGDILKTYRFASAVGAESTATLAGSSPTPKTVVLTWLANLVNASNNVLIRDVALKLELIANNDLVIFTQASTLPLPIAPYNTATIPAGMQPFPSPPYAPTTTLLNYSKNTLSAYIGYNNFNVGYIHNDGIGGGWANIDALHSTSDKCRGIGNPDYEIFIHEFGHMGGSNHNITEESGLRTTFGGTIMGNRSNTRASSGDQYSSHTIDRFTVGCYGATSNASQSNASGNNIPQILTMPPANIYIPKSTPFKLTGTASDADATQTLTYTWEQNDTSTVTFSTPNFPATTGPLFSSVFPTTNGATRYFPDLSFLTTGMTSVLETMPFAARKLNFRFIVRDNYALCGGLNFKNVRFSVDGNSGPFQITSLNTAGIVVTGNSTYNVTWNTNGTQNAPVNCSQVKITLSHDGGLTYPDALGTFPNNGAAIVIFPNITGTTKRIMVEGVGNVFFDINDKNFEIFDGTMAGLNTTTTLSEKVIHTQTSTALDINIQKLGTYSGTVTLSLSGVPSGATASFSNGLSTITLTPTTSTTLTISNLQALSQSRYPITITTTGNGGIIKTNIFTLIKTGVAAVTPGNAISFNGSSYASLSDINVPSNQVTFSCWIKRNVAVNADLEGLISFTTAPGTGSKPMLYVNSNGNLKYHENWGQSTAHFIVDGEWTFVAVVVVPDQATIYKNGVPSVISISDPSPLPFSGSMIVGAQTSSWRKFQGLIDEAKIWSRALTTAEIREQMHLTMPASEADNGLFSYYQCNQTTGEVVDVIRSHNMTLNSSPTYVASGAAVGTGTVQTKTVSSAGVTSFTSPNNTDLSINFGASPNGDVVVTKLSNSVPNGTAATALPTTSSYWAINNYGTNSALNATMTFTMTPGYVQGTNPTPYQLHKRSSTSVGAWNAPIVCSTINAASNQLSFAGVNSFSQFIMSFNAAALPIKLLDFQAIKENANVRLNWATATENNFEAFEIERADDAKTWSKIGIVAGAGTSNTVKNYTFLDINPIQGNSYYRLKQVDVGGAFEYSKIVTINTLSGKNTEKNSISIFPNPTNSTFTINGLEKYENTTILIFNNLGQNITFSQHKNQIDMSAFPKGIYYMQVSHEGRIVTGMNVVKQ
jgi:hypothetical protein